MKSYYYFYSDPGHGWLAVKRAELVELGIAGKISTCSYQRGDTVYLEEDCDASVFIDAKGKDNMKIVYKHVNYTAIRHYDSYRAFYP